MLCSRQKVFDAIIVVIGALLLIAIVTSVAKPVESSFVEHHVLHYDDSTLDSAVKERTEELVAKTGEIFPWNDMRLPSFILPMHYDLFLFPNLETFENSGSVNITFQVSTETNFIVLHAKKLNLSRILVTESNGNEIHVLQHLEYPRHEQVYIRIDGNFAPTLVYRLSLDFHSYLEENIQGFYLSSYKNEDGQKRYLATTNFQPTAARSAFPCFDEPAMKATFQLEIVHDENYKAYFNSEIWRIAPHSEGFSVSSFHRTVKMSTYLVAFILSDFRELEITNIDGTAIDGTKIRMLTPAEQFPKFVFALQIAADVLQFYKTFFNISYTLPKLDMAAIPDLYDTGVENWGLVSFRLDAISYNSLETPVYNQEIVASLVSHELAHQWFGNLVTMQWWNDLWLYKVFATFMEYIVLDNIRAEWNTWDEFSVMFTQHALMLDSLLSSHPIVVEDVDYSNIPLSLDLMSYRKGPALLNMLANFLGIETFQKGVSSYLKKYTFQNARTEDLWNEFTEFKFQCSSFPETISVAEKMSSETECKLEVKCILVLTGEFDLPAEANWLKVNVNRTGFYRVMYDTALWKKLINVLHSNHKTFSPADRVNLVDDAVSFTRAGILDTKLAFNLTRYLGKEDEYAPWRSALLRFEHINLLMRNSTSFLPLFQNYVRTLLKPIINKLGWEDAGSHMQKKLRSAILTAAILYDEEQTVARAQQIFQEWMQNGTSVPPNLRGAVYNAGVKYGGTEEWEFCLRKYQETEDPSEKNLLLIALASTRDASQLSLYLNYSLDKEIIRPQDTLIAIVYASRNSIGTSTTWEFVRSNWNMLLENYSADFMGNVISETITYFTPQEDHDKIKAFFKEVNVGPVLDSLNQSLEIMKINIQWRQNLEAFVFQWLQENVD